LQNVPEVINQNTYNSVDEIYRKTQKTISLESALGNMICLSALGLGFLTLLNKDSAEKNEKEQKNVELLTETLIKELDKKDLNSEQKIQLYKQILNHQHETYRTDIDLGNRILKDFWVYANVMRPEIMTSKNFAEYLSNNPCIYENKKVLDIGTGSGILGITTALNGAENVLCTDISNYAIENTTRNINYCHLKNIRVRKSDLFKNIKEKYDVILFNYPFFNETAISSEPVSMSMLGGKELVKDFFKQASSYLKDEGKIFVPFFDLAGDKTHPKIAEEYGFNVRIAKQLTNTDGLQNGNRAIYEITIK
jgi:release factor glutamine methyltransferase